MRKNAVASMRTCAKAHTCVPISNTCVHACMRVRTRGSLDARVHDYADASAAHVQARPCMQVVVVVVEVVVVVVVVVVGT
jgi:hypothetical protein